MMYTPFIYFIFLLSIISIRINGLQRENLAVRHPCYSINKRLEPYITWTERLASSQYKGESFNGERTLLCPCLMMMMMTGEIC